MIVAHPMVETMSQLGPKRGSACMSHRFRHLRDEDIIYNDLMNLGSLDTEKEFPRFATSLVLQKSQNNQIVFE